MLMINIKRSCYVVCNCNFILFDKICKIYDGTMFLLQKTSLQTSFGIFLSNVILFPRCNMKV